MLWKTHFCRTLQKEIIVIETEAQWAIIMEREKNKRTEKSFPYCSYLALPALALY